MSAELASLGVVITPKGIDKTTGQLRDFNTEGTRSEAVARALEAEARRAMAGVSAFGAAEAKAANDAGVMAAAQRAATEATTAAATATQAAEAASNGLVNAHGKATHAAALNGAQVAELGHIMRSTTGTILAGGSAFQALGYEANRIVSVLTIGQGGVGGTLKAIGGLISPVVVGVGAVAVVVGALGAAWLAGRHESEAFNKAVKMSGDFAGVTASQYESMAHRISDSTGQGLGKARATMLTLIQTGQFTAETIELISADAVKMADLTGESAQKVTEQFMAMSHGVGDFAVKFNSSYHLLTEAQIEHIRALEDEGKTEEAKYQASKDIYESLGRVAPENLGLIEKAWRAVGGAIAYAWDELKGFGRASVPEEQLRGLDQRIASLKAQNRGGYYDQTIDALERQRTALASVVTQQEAAAKAQTEANRVQQAGTDAAERLRTSWSHYGDSVKLANQEIARYRADVEALRRANPHSDLLPTSSQQKAAEADIRKRYTPDATHDASEAQHRAEALGREAAATEATITGNIKLAQAYQISGAEALKQAAATKATAAGLKEQGDVAEFVERQLRLSVSEQAAAGAKTLYDLTQQTAARKALNEAVAGGHMTVAEANKQMADEAVLRPLLAAQANAHGEALEVLTKIIDDLRRAQADANTTERDAQMLAATGAQKDQIAMLELQLSLIGATNKERAVALAHMQAEQDLAARSVKPGDAGYAEYIANAEHLAGLQVDLQTGQDNYNNSLNYTLDLLNQIADHTRDVASGLEQAFSGMDSHLQAAVKGLGGFATAITSLAAKERAIATQKAAQQKNQTKDSEAWMHAEILASRESSKARLDAYASMADAAKGFFEENSAGYKAMQVAEIALRTLEALNTIEAMAMDATHTASTVANAGTRATAHGIEAYARTLASLPFPFNMAAGAAVLAALAGVGVAIAGGGGSASVPGAHDAEDRQARQGTGTILGDTKAKSDSIVHSLEIVASNTNKDLEFTNGMLQHLRSIDSQIGAMAASVGRGLGPGGMLDTSGLSLGTSVQGPGGLQKLLNPLSWVLPGLFGTKTTTTLQDLGVQFNPQTIGQIIASGISGSTYQQTATEKKKKFFGFTYSDKTSVNTSTGALDSDFVRQTQLLIGSLRDGVVEAASVLGIQGAEATLNAFKLNLGKISFKDMSADEIQKTLENVFSAAADDMAHAVMPMLSQFQKAGEGQFETLSRLAREYQVVDVSMESIGRTFGSVGVTSIAARDRLVQLMGGLDDFASATSAYADAFLSDTDKLGPIRTAVATELARLGLSDVKTRDQFKGVVQGLDLTTEAGAEMYAALMNLAPAFAKVTEETKAVTDAKSALSDAYDRESGALQDTIDTFRDLAAGLHDYGRSLYTGPAAALSPEAQYQANRSEFERVAGLAATGDKTALGQLQNVSQAYLDASKDYYASSKGYFDDLTAVRDAVQQAETAAGAQVDVAQAQLDQMTSAVGQLIDLNQNTVSVQEAITNLQAAMAANTIPAAPIPVVVTQQPAQNDNQQQQLLDLLQQLLAQGGASQQQTAAIAGQNFGMLGNIVSLLSRLNREQQAA